MYSGKNTFGLAALDFIYKQINLLQNTKRTMVTTFDHVIDEVRYTKTIQ
jgi:hypothetical protein